MEKTWKWRRTDFIVAFAYYMLFVIGVHVLTNTFRKGRSDLFGETAMERVFSWPSFFFTLFLLSLFISPLWVYFSKVPRRVVLNSETKSLCIKRRRKSKSVRLNLSSLCYSHYSTSFFSVMEFYVRIPSSRGHTVIKKLSSIIVLNVGMPWNKNILKEIGASLEALNIPVNHNAKIKSFWNYIQD